MAMVKWDPMRELKVMQEQMNRMLEMSRERGIENFIESGGWEPPIDIYEDPGEVVVKVDLPGLDQGDIQVHIEDDVLIIQGERKPDPEERKQSYHRMERPYGSFRRTFSLPVTIDQDHVAASCEKGVLTIVLPKKGEAKSRSIEVEIT
jgi:HSP20 family protein